MKLEISDSLTTLVLLLLTGLSFWILEVHSISKKHPPFASTRPDTDLRDVDAFEFAQNGHLSAHLHLQRLYDLPGQTTHYFIQPHALLFTHDLKPWEIDAARGSSTKSLETIELQNHVRVYQPAQNNEPASTITTDHLSIDLQKHRLQTDAPVQILRADATITGTGLLANYKEGWLQLLQDTQSVIHIAPGVL